MNRFPLWFLLFAFLILGALSAPVLTAETEKNEFAYANLRNRLLQLEKQVADLSQASTLSSQTRVSRADALQAEIKKIKGTLAGRFDPADIALGETVDAIQEHGSAWFLRYLTHGRYTGRKSEHHRPLEAVDLPGKNPGLAGKAALPFLGYPLMVILSYDAVSREAYKEFITQMEAIVREMETRGGKAYEFWDKQPAVIPNDLGWDVDRFWMFARECAGKVVNRYFWRSSQTEVKRATDLVALIIATAFLNNVTIDVEGDKETQTKKAFWRANAAPWFTPDKTLFRNKFHIFHFFTHAWLTYLKFFNDTRFDGRILSEREAKPVTNGTLKNAIWFSNAVGFAYEGASTIAGTKHGFLETSSVQELPKSLKKVAQALHLKNIIMYESIKDLGDNKEGAWFGPAFFLSPNSPVISDLPSHRRIVETWRKSLKDGKENLMPETGGPQTGKGWFVNPTMISLYDLNSPAGKKRIDSGFFKQVYRGTGGFNPADHAAAELQAFRSLLTEDSLCFNLRKIYGALETLLDTPFQAYKKAKERHAELIRMHFEETDPDKREMMFRDLFSNEGSKASEGDYNHEADYIFTTPRADIAGCYGPVVLTISEKKPRGLDLNQIAESYKYYSRIRMMKNAIKLRWKTLIGDKLLDKDEYLIPSFVSSSEIVGVVVRSPKAHAFKNHIEAADKDFSIALKAPPILRTYEKRLISGYQVIDVRDPKGRLIRRFSESPENTPAPEEVPNDAGNLPAPILAAWEDHLRAIGKAEKNPE